MDLSPTKTSYSITDNKRWLGDEHGTESTFSVTLDLPAFADDVVPFTDSRGIPGFKIRSGTPVRKGAGTKYVPCVTDEAGTDTQNADCAGHLFEDVIYKTGATEAAGAVQWHGVVITANIPRPANVAAAFDKTKGAKHVLYR